MLKRILIFTGGRLGPWALEEIKVEDVVYGADRGAHFLVTHKINPDLAIGDFDSVSQEELNYITSQSVQTITCDPIYKDFTDTEMAFEHALLQKPDEIVLIGALGSRFDHSLANVHLLRKAQEREIACTIVDEKNEIILTTEQATIVKKQFNNVSLLPLSMEVTGITLQGFQYPLHDATLRIGQSLGISNVLEGEVGHISISSGLLLIIQSKD